MKKIKFFVNKIFKFLNGEREIDGFLRNDLYPRLSQGQIGYILTVINDEINKSTKFGLNILPEHQLKEKYTIMAIFNEWGQTLQRDGPKYSSTDYSAMIHDLINMACKILENEITYYFGSFTEDSIRNRYNCHLVVLVSRLARDFMDDKVPLKLK